MRSQSPTRRRGAASPPASARLARLCAAALGALAAAGCQSVSQMKDPLAPDVIQEAGLTDLMLESGDPRAAVTYFEGAVQRSPEKDELWRSLARAYVRAGRLAEAQSAYGTLAGRGAAGSDDWVEKGFVAVRLGDWSAAQEALGRSSPAQDTARRALLEALLADHDRRWPEADAAYARALGDAGDRGAALNNWGVSLLARGEAAAAETKFAEAAAADPRLFAARNNLALARAMSGTFTPPETPLTDAERAVVLHNMGLVARRQGAEAEARRLFTAAIAAHPQHFTPAAQQLATLSTP